jgi:hypothetical protein
MPLVDSSGVLLAFILPADSKAYFSLALERANQQALARRAESVSAGETPWPPDYLAKIIKIRLIDNLGGTAVHRPDLSLDLPALQHWWEMQFLRPGAEKTGVRVPRSCYDAFILSKAKRF